jgi:F-box/TPR repeat protein Pof3
MCPSLKQANFMKPDLAKATVAVQSVALNGWQLRNLHGISEWTSLRDLDLGNTNLTMLPQLPRTLRRLIIRENRHLKGFNINEGEILSLPLLEIFDCAGTDLASFWVHTILLPSIKHGNLRVLSIGDRLIHGEEAGLVEVATWAKEFPPSQTLEELSLAGSLLEEARLIKAVKQYPNIQVLDVSCTKVTGVAIKTFVKSGIKYLKVNECQSIGLDAVDWARSQGVQVEFNFPSRSTATRGFRDAFS